MSETGYDWFVEQLYGWLGIDLKKYKRQQMERRLLAFVQRTGYADFREFFRVMQNSASLRDDFLDRMTINVSEFFRNPNRWEILDKQVIPDLLQDRSRLKIWSSACATGEEPYSLAMLMQKHLPLGDFDIIATDIDEQALAAAKKAIYPARALNGLPLDACSSFRQVGEDQFEVAPRLRERVTFSRLNLLEDPFDGGYDLILCRNVLIYFEDTAKELLYRKFSRSLRKRGILFVGSTEQIFSPRQYQLANYDVFFYQKYSS